MASAKIRKFFTMGIVDCAQVLQSLHVPGAVISADISAGWVEVGANNIIRVVVSANTSIAFSDDNTLGAVSSTTDPAVMVIAGESYIITTAKYVRASANPVRVELLGL
jgi:hypothetical protein